MKTTLRSFLCVFALFLVGCVTSHPPETVWDYKVIQMGVASGNLEKTLNQLGQQGWTVASSATSGTDSYMLVVVLKRPQTEAETKARVAGNKLISARQAFPLDLTTNYTTPASYFDQIAQFPAWKTVPRGYQFFAGVPLDIEGMICLWGENNTTQLHIVFPEQLTGIAVKQKFETLYVYHGSFFASPAGTPVCGIVFNYADGSSATNQMRYDEDVLDWIANSDGAIIGPTAKRSGLAWIGGSFATTSIRPLRLCLTAIENPQPALEVKTIDLYSAKSPTAPCIMALTVGKAGLLKK